ncbi:hypothetical protein Fcan01_11121 [Folsomia candida]|uniref:Uncharacterized protein n=1 Tax=Folsomia candida TaxID=158441 RepID=A0A226EA44_FOLCA|nr:hypothetical protein Fcan01_11121 [Folsomia candida]
MGSYSRSVAEYGHSLSNIMTYLQNTVLPNKSPTNVGEPSLSSSPSLVILLLSGEPTLEETVFETNVVTILHDTLFYGSSYFAVRNSQMFPLCLHCHLLGPAIQTLDTPPDGVIWTTENVQSLEPLHQNWEKFNKNFHHLTFYTGSGGFMGSPTPLGKSCLDRVNPDKTNVASVDYCIAFVISRKYNFTLHHIQSPAMIRSSLQVSFNTKYNRENHFIKKTSQFRFLYDPYCSQQLGFSLRLYVHKNQTRINVAFALASVFHYTTWSLVVVFLTVYGVLCWVMFSLKFEKVPPMSDIVLSLFIMSLGQSNVQHNLRCRDCSASFGYLGLTYTILVFILATAYSGNFISFFVAQPGINLPKNIRPAVSTKEVTLLTTSLVVTVWEFSERYLKNQMIGQELQIGEHTKSSVTWLTDFYNKVYEPQGDVAIKPVRDILFNLSYGCSLHLIKRDFNEEPKNVSVTVDDHGIFGFINTKGDTQLAEEIAGMSGNFAALDHYSYNGKDLTIDSGTMVIAVQAIFMGNVFHDHLGRMDNTGLFQRWKEQRDNNWSVKLEREKWMDSMRKYGINPNKGLFSRGGPDQPGLEFRGVYGVIQLMAVLTGVAGVVFVIECAWKYSR